MSNRVLKQSICDSETVAALKEWGAEVTFCRVMVACCDDYGRFDARPAVVRAKCFPLVLDRVPEAQVDAWLLDLQRVGLVQLYDANGRRYGAMSKWANHQRVRNAVSKIPPPPVDNLLTIDGDPLTTAADCGLTPDTRHRTPDTRNQTTELGKASSDADAGRVSPDPTPDPKAAERAERRRLAEVNLAWFHRRYAEIVGHDSPDKPTDGRIHPAEVRAAEKLSRLVKAGRYAPRQLDGVLRAWLKGEFFSSPNGKLSTFVAVLASGKLDLAANRKSPRVDETPGAGRSGTGSGGFKTVGKILTGGE